MIRSEERAYGDFDKSLLTDYAAEELRQADESGIAGLAHHLVFDDDEFLLAFSIRKSKTFMMPSEIFLLLGKKFSPRYARVAKDVFTGLVHFHSGLACAINIEHQPAVRFAEFLGLIPRGPVIEHLNRRFRLYEVYP